MLYGDNLPEDKYMRQKKDICPRSIEELTGYEPVALPLTMLS